MVLKVIGIIALVIAGILIYAALQPSEYLITRELVIKASPEVLFPYINNSQKSNEWMPWKDSDPDVKMSYSGPAEGVGSVASWDSPGKMGTGRAEVVGSVENQSVKTQLTYTKPMEMSQLAEVSLTPASEGTVVRWAVTGHNNWIGRVVCLFMNMDKMVGGEFEKGLSNLKTLAEGKSQ